MFTSRAWSCKGSTRRRLRTRSLRRGRTREGIGCVFITTSTHRVSFHLSPLFQLLFSHSHVQIVRLPLWEPSPVELGAVGYLSRPSGSFVTLFNSFNPQKSSAGKCEGMPSLYGYGSVSKGSQRIMRRSAAQRGLDVIQGLLWFRSRSSGDFQ